MAVCSGLSARERRGCQPGHVETFVVAFALVIVDVVAAVLFALVLVDVAVVVF